MERRESGYRIFTEKDIATLRIIDCLKKTGMPIKEIRQFSDWLEQGDASLPVSYTHLDVYKRQPANCSVTSGRCDHKFI